MTGFAARFSDSQRAALAALGYAVLELRSGPSFSEDARDRANAPPAPPGRIVIDGMDGSQLARGILGAAIATRGDARVRQAGERLEIVLGGDGDAWNVTLEQLRRSPRQKAALWRALRGSERAASRSRS